MEGVIKIINRKSGLFDQDIFSFEEEVSEIVSHASFLVIGGGGTIGQSVTKEIFKRNPKKLDVVDLSELVPMIYGKVVWKSNSFKEIDFLKHITEEPNLFLKKEDDLEIPLFLNRDKKEIA